MSLITSTNDLKKKELGLEYMSDSDILKYSLQCSMEIKQELKQRNDNVDYFNLVDVLSKADEVILGALTKK